MQVKAQLNGLRISPRKMRLLADYIRGKKAGQARALLGVRIKRGALPMKKLLESAIANAKNNFSLDEKSLVISQIFVNEGAKLKRWHAMSRGRAFPIQKKTSRITIILEGQSKAKAKRVSEDEQEGGGEHEKSGKEAEAKKAFKTKKFGSKQYDFIDRSVKKTSSKIFRRKAIS